MTTKAQAFGAEGPEELRKTQAQYVAADAFVEKARTCGH